MSQQGQCLIRLPREDIGRRQGTAVGRAGIFGICLFEAGDSIVEMFGFEQQFAHARLRGGVVRKLLVDLDGFAVLRRLLVQAGEFQQVIAILRLQFCRLMEVYVGVAEASFLHQRLRHAELCSGGFGVER